MYYATNLNLQTRQEALLQQKMEVIRHLVDENAATGDSTTLRHKLSDFFYGRPDFSLVLEIDGAKTVFGAGIAEEEDHAHERRIVFSCRRRARRAMPCTPSWCWTSRPTCICAPRWPGP